MIEVRKGLTATVPESRSPAFLQEERGFEANEAKGVVAGTLEENRSASDDLMLELMKGTSPKCRLTHRTKNKHG